LFICAKNLLLEAMASTGPGNFEPGARTRRPTVVGAALKMSASSMSDEFDSLDATEKAAVEAALNRCRTLAAKIESDLRNKRPEHFVDELALAPPLIEGDLRLLTLSRAGCGLSESRNSRFKMH
jgi:hypothetical protein